MKSRYLYFMLQPCRRRYICQCKLCRWGRCLSHFCEFSYAGNFQFYSLLPVDLGPKLSFPEKEWRWVRRTNPTAPGTPASRPSSNSSCQSNFLKYVAFNADEFWFRTKHTFSVVTNTSLLLGWVENNRRHVQAAAFLEVLLPCCLVVW
jgi:hypothetical protein